MKKVSCPSCNADSSDEMITMHSGVNHEGNGFIHLAWGRESELRCQFTPAQAREHALYLLECAEAAEMDSMVIRFLRSAGGTLTEGTAFISRLRQYRDEQFIAKGKGEKS